jgi:hypothetical protein
VEGVVNYLDLRERRFLRNRHLTHHEPRWGAIPEAIEGTVHEKYFPDGKPTKGWYQGWLHRMKCLT